MPVITGFHNRDLFLLAHTTANCQAPSAGHRFFSILKPVKLASLILSPSTSAPVRLQIKVNSNAAAGA
jgi:hypothetical protein